MKYIVEQVFKKKAIVHYQILFCTRELIICNFHGKIRRINKVTHYCLARVDS